MTSKGPYKITVFPVFLIARTRAKNVRGWHISIVFAHLPFIQPKALSDLRFKKTGVPLSQRQPPPPFVYENLRKSKYTTSQLLDH
jgi:hypothetical protein